MKPIEPREDGRFRTTYAKDQKQYLPLPATVGDSPEFEITTEWELDDEERATLVRGGRIRLQIWTFGAPLQPLKMSAVDAPCPTETV